MLWKQYALLFGVEVVVFILVAISAFQLYRTGRTGELSFVIYTDAIMFYVYMLCISGVNLIMILTVTTNLSFMLVTFENVMHTIFTTHIFLNIRAAVTNLSYPDLHTSCFEFEMSRDVTLPSISRSRAQNIGRD